MSNEGLSERIEKARSRPPLTGKEREKALETLDDLIINMQTIDIRINVLKKLMKEEDIYFEGTISKGDYEQIAKEWGSIYDILSKNSIENIRLLIEKERINNPDNYLPIVEDKMITRELKIREFFTFNRYLVRRMYNLDKEDCIDFIKNMALKNDAYEFLEDLK